MTTTTTLTSLKFPRTGKRGVPQQFPRNLYDMLEAESKLIQADASHPKIISWSESGKAFRIHDVSEFSASVLPRYFRTKKFSSFQRNLNLYGFAKVRKGPDLDMYAHPSFIRDFPDSLLQLRKLGGARKQPPSPLRPVSPTASAESSIESATRRRPTISSSPAIPSYFQARTMINIRPPLPTMSSVPRKISGADEQRGCLDLLTLAMEYADVLEK